MFQVQLICHYPRLSIPTAVLPPPHEYEAQHEGFAKLELNFLLYETLVIIQNLLLASVDYIAFLGKCVDLFDVNTRFTS
ncbi:hypothetical protein VN97_g6113 [Penicillium thymicola]|uniref:Uncharacterized protein n=1 Tax=Penicillium thymicola TaxID=293382 RepID=A0AAI9TIT2_PENTH|nr:hypothetical protein VN97_g6113 [Penicillium thymicola]